MQFNFYRYRECFSNQTHFPWHPDSWCLDVLRYGSRDLSTLRHPAKTEAQAHYPMFHISPSTPAVCLTDVPLTMLCLWTEIIHGPSKYKRVQHKSFTAPWSWLVIFSLVATFIGSKVHSAPLRLCGKSPSRSSSFRTSWTVRRLLGSWQSQRPNGRHRSPMSLHLSLSDGICIPVLMDCWWSDPMASNVGLSAWCFPKSGNQW